MFKKAIITKTPKGTFHFVGRVPASLMNTSYSTVDEAKVAAIDAMMEIGETFPVDVQAIG